VVDVSDDRSTGIPDREALEISIRSPATYGRLRRNYVFSSIASPTVKQRSERHGTTPGLIGGFLTRSIAEFGLVDPIIARAADKTVIGGHQRLLAARRLGLKTVPVIYLDITKEKAQLLNVALNKISGDFDQELLARLLADLGTTPDLDLTLSGFEEKRSSSCSKDWRPGRSGSARRHSTSTPLFAPPMRTPAPRGATSSSSATIDYCVGTPPARKTWNACWPESEPRWPSPTRRTTSLSATTGASNKAKPSAHQERLHRAGSLEGLLPGLGPQPGRIRRRRSLYLHVDQGVAHGLPGTCEVGGHWSDTIIWEKDRFVLGRSDYQRSYEPIWYGWREGAKHHFAGGRDQGDVWKIERPSDSPLHPTMKPLPLVERAIENSSAAGDGVRDLFLGSGSPLIAAERTGRVCYGLEVTHTIVPWCWQDGRRSPGAKRRR